MGTTIPKLLEILTGYGVASDELLRQIDDLAARFPAGEVPLDVLESVIRDHIGSDVLNNIVLSVRDAALDALRTGRSIIKDDDSALA